ncbi:hypothetical protein JZ751_029518, partial [Albula glossodonta]
AVRDVTETDPDRILSGANGSARGSGSHKGIKRDGSVYVSLDRGQRERRRAARMFFWPFLGCDPQRASPVRMKWGPARPENKQPVPTSANSAVTEKRFTQGTSGKKTQPIHMNGIGLSEATAVPESVVSLGVTRFFPPLRSSPPLSVLMEADSQGDETGSPFSPNRRSLLPSFSQLFRYSSDT